ncbi:hypothetical protein [uncultured Megasphaera sp.]|uniref:hypothetical protein n=1 Tax=uncultured Megasphaera sp. TaxID=165188 RepID=UPI0026005106|nr:hypothetical protein [uncultured Megasphaera sp.]
MNKGYTFDDMINTMMPLPFDGSANGEGIYCRGQALVASMSEQKQAVHQEKDKHSFTLKGIFSRYCID